MRKLLIISALAISTLFTSCNDMIDVVPENAATFGNFFKQEKDLESLIYAAHSLFRASHNCSYWASYYPQAIGMFADTCRANYVKGYRRLDPTKFNPSSYANDWSNHYAVIAQVNTLLDNVNKISGVPDDRKDFYIGQSKFLRAYEYFHIAKVWGKAPLVTKPSEIRPIGCSSTLEILDFAIQETLDAIELLPTNDKLKDISGAKITNKQIAGKYTAYTLLAHIYAWKASICKHDESWKLAEDAATEVIKNGGYVMASNAEAICTEVMDRNSSESIMELNIDWAEIPSHIYNRWEVFLASMYVSYPLIANKTVAHIARCRYGIKSSTVENMYKDGDERRNAYFYNFEEIKNNPDAKGYAALYKWRKSFLFQDSWSPSPRWYNLDGNVIMFRLAGLYLLRAECRVRQGHNGPAVDDLNFVRSRSNASPYNESEGDLRYTIYKEREKELLLEGQRYFDIVRNGYWKTELSDQHAALTQEDVDRGALYLPIHRGAFNDNPLIRQNEWWNGKW